MNLEYPRLAPIIPSLGRIHTIRLTTRYPDPEEQATSQGNLMSEQITDPDDLYDAANQLKEDGRLEEAVEALKKILVSQPDHLQTHLALGVHLQKLGQIDQALEHATKVAELEPNDAFSHVQLSVIMQRCGRITEAEDAMAKAQAIKAQETTPQ